MPALFEYAHGVATEEIDSLGHVNNLAYVRWMQDAAVAHSAAQGWDTPRYQAAGFGWVVRSHSIEYLQPAFDGQQIVVKTWVADLRRVTSLRRYEMWRPSDNTRLAVAHTNWAFVNFATGLLLRIPPEVATAFEIIPDPPEEPRTK